MKLLDRIHEQYVFRWRVQRLVEHISNVIPLRCSVLDVGCGDGLLAHLLLERRPDIRLRGLDVLRRSREYIPVATFDGKRIPFPDDSFDVIMFVDVLHHTESPADLIREAARAARAAVLIKDHTLDGLLARRTLTLMDAIGNARHGVALPYNYWHRRQWLETFSALDFELLHWDSKLQLYPGALDWLFGRSLHFIAFLGVRGSASSAGAPSCSAHPAWG